MAKRNKRRRLSDKQIAKMQAELDEQAEAAKRGVELREGIEKILPAEVRETLPELSWLTAGVLGDDLASFGNAAQMMMERQGAKAELEGVAVKAGARVAVTDVHGNRCPEQEAFLNGEPPAGDEE